MQFILMLLMLQQSSFKEAQLKNARVKEAYAEKENSVKNYFREQGLSYPGFRLFLRAFKKEKLIEVWVREKGKESYVRLHQYDFCAFSGVLGPKRKEGDYQIPEGIYYINHFNPQSNFYLSLGINYPNSSDKILSNKKSPGGAIYIHGNCVTVGCIPITDDKIKELYILAVEARNNGQEKIPVHIFPSRLDENGIKDLTRDHGSANLEFWKNLSVVYQDFEKTKQIKSIIVNDSGGYLLR
jgi:murein L,D-transpeptidase YafK